MISKPDKECVKRGDIALLSEIISNFMYWQVICKIRFFLKLQYIV